MKCIGRYEVSQALGYLTPAEFEENRLAREHELELK